jgi:hypothetical protein
MTGKNPLGSGKEPQSYEGLNIIVPIGGWQLIRAKRDPTTNDKKYPVGALWVNTSSQNVWIETQPAGVWTELAASAGNVDSITGTANQIAASSATGNVTLSLIGPYTPATYTAHGVLLGEGTSSIVATTAGTSGQVLVGGTSDPAFATISTTTGVAFTTGNNTLAIDIKFGGYAVVDQTSSTATLAKQTSYVTDNGASLVTYTLPLAANAIQGNVYQVTGGSVGGWSIAQNASQTIHIGAQNTTTGVNGSISSNSRFASLTLQCINATGLDFVVIAQSGTFTIV